jgi:hypothetical protein
VTAGRFTRREALTMLGGASLAALVPPSVLAACGASPPKVLTDHQVDVVREATARLIPGPHDDPAEAGHPGAREANVTGYITTMLGALAVSPPKVYAGGPFSNRAGNATDDFAHFLPLDGPTGQAWRARLAAIRTAYQQGLSAYDRSPGFLHLSASRRDAVLATNPKVAGLPTGYTGFTDLLFAHAIEGYLSAPEYGGNAGLVGWKDIGFPGDVQPRGYTPDQVSGPISHDRLAVTGIVASLLHLVTSTAPAPLQQSRQP